MTSDSKLLVQKLTRLQRCSTRRSRNGPATVADQLQRQQTELEQKYLAAIQASQQQRDFLQHAAGTDADKAAEVLHQKEQEWTRHLASAQQDALQQLQQQAQQELQQKQQQWKECL